jgi:hypothetical protein
MNYKMLAVAAVPFVTTLIIRGAQTQAHNAFAAGYLDDTTQKIEGKLAQLINRNPRSFVHVDARDENGRMQTWAIEWEAASQLNLTGGSEALKPGDPVVVLGNPARNPESHRLRMLSITRTSDGWKWNAPAS